MKNSNLLVTVIHGLVGQYLFRVLQGLEGTVVITGKGLNRLPDDSGLRPAITRTGLVYGNVLVGTRPNVVSGFASHWKTIVLLPLRNIIFRP